MYSITENIYYSQLSSVAILLQPEPVSHRIIQGKDCVLSPSVLSSCGLPLPPMCLLLTVNEARSYFASTTIGGRKVAYWAASNFANIRAIKSREMTKTCGNHETRHVEHSGWVMLPLLWACQLGSHSWRQGLVKGSYVISYKHLGSIRGGEFLDWVTINLPRPLLHRIISGLCIQTSEVNIKLSIYRHLGEEV
jgi:hypothetical protein